MAGTFQKIVTKGKHGTRPGERATGWTGIEPRIASERRPAADRGVTRIAVVAYSKSLLEELEELLRSQGEVEVVKTTMGVELRAAELADRGVEVLLLGTSESEAEDLRMIRSVRTASPGTPILFLGAEGSRAEFLQYVRAGVRGYLVLGATGEEIIEGVKALGKGEAVCAGELCAHIFAYLENEATSLPSAGIRERLGLTRREQQLIPLVAQGMTNKEIANHFCLSEQTVKNHLYRMKHKVGAGDRLGIVQTCRTHGFML